MTKPARAKEPGPDRHAEDAAILWAAKVEGLSPIEQRVLLMLCQCEVKRNRDGPGWVAYPSLTQLAAKAEVSRRATVNAIDELLERGLMTRIPGNVKGDTTTYTFGPGVTAAAPSASHALGHTVPQGKSFPRAPGAHKSKEVSTSSKQDPIFKGGGGQAPPPPDKPTTRQPEKRTLWPAAQPPALQAVVDKHARWWTDLVRWATFPGNSKPDWEAEEEALIDAAVTRVGGWARIQGFKQRPRDSSFARDEFLDYLRRHDPVYAKVAGHVQVSTRASPAAAAAKAKAAGGVR